MTTPFGILFASRYFTNSATMLAGSLPGPAGGAYRLTWLATVSELM